MLSYHHVSPKIKLAWVHNVKVIQLLVHKCARSLTRKKDEEESNKKRAKPFDQKTSGKRQN
jgi:hypothetical protein